MANPARKRIFISHSGAAVQTDAVASQLRQAGHEPFLDLQHIPGGAPWEALLHERLRECDALVLCLTPEACESRWVWAEVLIARHLDIAVIPLLLDGTVPDFLAQRVQHIDMRQDPTRGYERLFQALEGLATTPGSPDPVSPQADVAAIWNRLAVRVLAGTGPAVPTDARAARLLHLDGPFGIAVDEAGFVYVGNRQGHGIRRISQDGLAEVFCAKGAFAQLAVAGDVGTLFAVSDSAHTVHRFELDTGVETCIAGSAFHDGDGGDGGPPGPARLHGPRGVAVDPSGYRIYVADTRNHRIRMIRTVDQTIETIAGNGTRGYSGDRGPARAAQLNLPGFLALDLPSGSLFVADEGNHCIRRIRLEDGEITTLIGTGQPGDAPDGTPAAQAALKQPAGIVVTRFGLCFAEAGHHRIRVIDPGGAVFTIAGSGQSGYSGDARDARQAELWVPTGLAIDDRRHAILVADTAHDQVKALVQR